MKTNRSAMAQLKIVSANVSAELRRLNEQGFALYDIENIDELTVQVFVSGREYKDIMRILEKSGAQVKLLNDSEYHFSGLRFWKRPVLFIGVLMIFLASLSMSTRVLFVRVEGNEQVPARLIQEQAANCGIHMGAKSSTIRSEKVKNQLLEAIPQLQWAGVNTTGCVATIRVEEKSPPIDQAAPKDKVTSIVASDDGIVESVTVTSGNGICTVGQAVKAGQTLISGYTDCGILIKASQAKGEVYAKTLHSLHAVTLSKSIARTKETKTEVSYSLKIGKKLINFDKGSGISPSTCVKMYEESYVRLPGGFVLPISLICQTTVFYDTVSCVSAVPQQQYEKNVEEYLLSQMVAGKILRTDVQVDTYEDYTVLTGQYLCSEMIGRTKIEQVLQGEKKRD